MPSSRGSSQLRDGTHVPYISCIAGRFFIHWATWQAQGRIKIHINKLTSPLPAWSSFLRTNWVAVSWALVFNKTLIKTWAHNSDVGCFFKLTLNIFSNFLSFLTSHTEKIECLRLTQMTKPPIAPWLTHTGRLHIYPVAMAIVGTVTFPFAILPKESFWASWRVERQTKWIFAHVQTSLELLLCKIRRLPKVRCF